ncbi:MAG: hypothetical protein ACKVP7_00645 [Hyphomicrobiaceae bacterium]
MISERFAALLKRLNAARADLDQEQGRASPSELRMIRAKAIMLRLQLQIRELVTSVTYPAELAPARYSPPVRRPNSIDGSLR